jgi:hypothetical protein
MGTERGLDWRIQIGDSGTPTELFNNIGGEISFEWKRSSEEIDESTKDDGIYGSTSYGQQKIMISVNGNLKLPDTGIQAAAAASKASPPEVNVKIVKGATVKFAGKVAIGNFSTSHDKKGPVTWSFDMANVGAPTTDNLGA